MADLDDLVAVSQYAGRDVLLVQGGGGNSSVKSPDGRRMWIKASGLRLAQVRPGYGYVEMDVPALLTLLADPGLAVLPRQPAHEAAVVRTQSATVDATTWRPSLETTFHAVLGRLVLHTHSVFANAFTCMVGGAEALAGMPATGVEDAPQWVPYATPGYALGRVVAEAVRSWQAQYGIPPGSLVLANHGFIAAADDGAAAVARTERMVQVGQRYFGPLPASACEAGVPPPALAAWAEALQAALARRYGLASGAISIRPATRTALLSAASKPEQWLLAGALVPDDVVYGGHRVWLADPSRSPALWVDDNPEAWPETGRLIVAVRGLGVAFAGPSDAFLDAMEENLLAHVFVRQLIARRGDAQPLPSEEVKYLLAMESERYRQRVAASRPD